jgi:hypothetical protein
MGGGVVATSAAAHPELFRAAQLRVPAEFFPRSWALCARRCLRANIGRAISNLRGMRRALASKAFMALGDDVYLICNNTRSSMAEIARNPRWLSAQVPFADLSEKDLRGRALI